MADNSHDDKARPATAQRGSRDDGTALSRSTRTMDGDNEASHPNGDDLIRSNRRLSLLSQVSNSFIVGDNPRQELSASFDVVADELGADFYFNYRTDDLYPGTLFLDSSRGPPPNETHPLSPILFGQYLCGQVAQTRRPLIVENIDTLEDDATSQVRSMGMKAYACLPLIAHGYLFGTIALGSIRQPRFTSSDIAFLTTLADQFAFMLDRSRLLQSLRDSDVRLRAEVARRQQAEDTLRQNVTLFSTLIEQAPTGVIVVDAKFCLHQINALAMPVFETVHPLIGRNFSQVIEVLWGKDLGTQIVHIFRHTLDTGERYVSPVFSEQRQDLGVEQSYEWETQRITLPDGQYGVACYFRDITERQKAETQLNEIQARLRHAADAARLTYVEVDFVRDRLKTADNFKTVMGYASPAGEAADAELGTRLLLDHVVPEDRTRVEAALKQFLTGTPTGKIDYRVLGDDQIERNIESLWSAEIGPDGTPQRAFATNLDISARTAAELKVRTSETRYRRLFEAAQDGVLLIDPATCKITDANPFMTTLLGYSHGQLVGKQLFEIGLLKDEAVSQDMFQKLKREGHVRYENLPLESQGGRLQAVEVVANVYDENGHAVIQCNIRDITERKQAEAHAKLLMSEVNHRSKNLLTVVQAVARQTARTGDPATFVARLSERIDALAALQDLLVKNQWRGVDVADLVAVQLAHFKDLLGKRVLIEGPPARLTPAAAQGVGMALHELSTNAGKYGALSNTAGRVHVSWRLSDANRPDFLISWLEEGGPKVAPPGHIGFGGMVLGRMAELAVGGMAEIDYRESGLSWKLSAPIESTLEPLGPARSLRSY